MENTDQIPGPVLYAAVGADRKTDLVTDWGFHQGQRVMGAASSADLLKAWQEYRTDDISPLITQDVLLMAGIKDHYMRSTCSPSKLLTLTAARSVTARVFTEAEQAQNHCQVGNTGLAIKVILDGNARRCLGPD